MKKILTFLLMIFLLSATGCGAPKITEDIQTQTPAKGNHIAEIVTNHGSIKLKLFPELAPETVKNFEELAKTGKYDNNLFHRVIKDFMIQGGDVESKDGFGGYSYKGPGTTIPDEFHDYLTNIRGALSMANKGQPGTGSSQFFIVQAKDGALWLDGKHSVFGQVYEGMSVVDEIAALETSVMEKPVEDAVIETIKISEY